MDNLVEFQAWKSPETILELAHVIVMSRPGINPTAMNVMRRERIMECVVPEIDISSSEVRRRVKEGKSIRYLVPAAVEECIVRHHLYR
jgi:nicotinate-nucleotide adenylyltransferase